jgi:hypothetical protein
MSTKFLKKSIVANGLQRHYASLEKRHKRMDLANNILEKSAYSIRYNLSGSFSCFRDMMIMVNNQNGAYTKFPTSPSTIGGMVSNPNTPAPTTFQNATARKK